MRQWSPGEKWRVIISGVIITALPIIALTLFVYSEIADYIKENVMNENGQSAALVSASIMKALDDEIRLGNLLVPRLKAGIKLADRKEITGHLEDLIDNSITIDRAYITNSGGIMLADYPADPSARYMDFSGYDWYKGVSTNWQPYVSEFYPRNSGQHMYLLAIAIPVRAEDNGIAGILVLQPRANYLKSVLAYVPLNQGQKIYVVDREGNLIYNSAYGIDRVINVSSFPAVQRVVKGDTGVETLSNPDGQRVIAAFRHIKEHGWGVVVERPEREVFALLREVTFGLFVFASIMLFTGVYFAHKRSVLIYSLHKSSEYLETRVDKRTAELNIANAQLSAEIEERKRMEEEIKHLAHHDALTGLPNRRLFIRIMDLELAEARRHLTKVALLFLDLDRFKEVNDTLGHEAGDQLLKEVAARLKESIRESDSISRFGGDEFSIILAGIVRAVDISDTAGKIIESLGRPFHIGGHELHVTASLGVSIYPDDSTAVNALLRYADIAMYHAKESGRNTFEFYDPAINRLNLEKMKMKGMLRQAIKRDELLVYYQPQVNIESRQMVCAEALVRWKHPERGLLEAKHFVSAAEHTGFITAIDEWVLKSVCVQSRLWSDEGLPPVCITVNLSAREFHDPELAKKISATLEDSGISPKYLHIEITESLAMKNIESTIARLNELVEKGVSISIDDFGTGYSSLNYLKKLPITKLKIDQSFIKDIAADSDDRAIISAVTAMAHNMGMKVLAEGVETEDQLSFLRSEHCDEAQGYFFGKPLPAEEFAELVPGWTA